MDEVLCLHHIRPPAISPVPRVACEVSKDISSQSIVVMKDFKYDSRSLEVAAMGRDSLTVPNEDINFASKVSTVKSKGCDVPNKDNKQASQDYTVRSKGFTAPSEDMKYASTLFAVRSKGLTVPSEGTKINSSVPTVNSLGFTVSSEDNNYARTYTEVTSKVSKRALLVAAVVSEGMIFAM